MRRPEMEMACLKISPADANDTDLPRRCYDSSLCVCARVGACQTFSLFVYFFLGGCCRSVIILCLYHVGVTVKTSRHGRKDILDIVEAHLHCAILDCRRRKLKIMGEMW